MHSTSLLQRGLVIGLISAGLVACGGADEPSSASAKAKDAVRINPDPFQALINLSLLPRPSFKMSALLMVLAGYSKTPVLFYKMAKSQLWAMTL